MDQDPRAAADLTNAAALCTDLANQIAELAVILPEAAAAAEYLAEAARACGDAGQLVAGATTVGRTWAAETVGAASSSGVTPASRDAAAGSSPRTAPERGEAVQDEEQVKQIKLDLSIAPTAPEPVAAQDRQHVELSSKDPEHIPVLSAPPAGATIRVDEKFSYSTDTAGRVSTANAKLDIVDLAHPRDEAAQRRLAGKLPGDHAGHIFARIFQGPIGTMNLTPMAGATVNLSVYKTMENHWRRIINDGGTVDVFVTFTYAGDSRRPDTIWVEYEHGDELVARRISNDPIASEGTS